MTDDADMLRNAACPGTGPKNFVNPHNINSFIGCTVIQGEIRILPTTFLGFALLLFYLVFLRSFQGVTFSTFIEHIPPAILGTIMDKLNCNYAFVLLQHHRKYLS